MKRTDSEKRKRMEKKLRAYYQTCVKPVDKWGPYYEPEQMLDGTDVDAVIKRKRAHKIILSEAFNSENKNRFKFKKKNAAAPQAALSKKKTEIPQAESGPASPQATDQVSGGGGDVLD